MTSFSACRLRVLKPKSNRCDGKRHLMNNFFLFLSQWKTILGINLIIFVKTKSKKKTSNIDNESRQVKNQTKRLNENSLVVCKRNVILLFRELFKNFFSYRLRMKIDNINMTFLLFIQFLCDIANVDH